MKNILIPVADRFKVIPNIYFYDLTRTIKKYSPNWANIIYCNSKNILRTLENCHFIDIVIFIRGYGAKDGLNYCKKNNILTILQFDDLHYFSEESKKERHFFFSNSDILLIPYYQHFLALKEYKPYHKKAANFPFYAPEIAINIGQKAKSEYRQNKIFFSGNCSNSYPLRKQIQEFAKANLSKFFVLNHPGYFGANHNVIGDLYYDMITNFKAAIVITGKSPINYPILKYFEISACKAIPIFEKIKVLNDLGFKEWEHYIPLDNINFKKQLLGLDIKNYSEISRQAFKLVKENHMPKKRIKQLFNIISKNKIIHWNEI